MQSHSMVTRSKLDNTSSTSRDIWKRLTTILKGALICRGFSGNVRAVTGVGEGGEEAAGVHKGTVQRPV